MKVFFRKLEFIVMVFAFSSHLQAQTSPIPVGTPLIAEYVDIRLANLSYTCGGGSAVDTICFDVQMKTHPTYYSSSTYLFLGATVFIDFYLEPGVAFNCVMGSVKADVAPANAWMITTINRIAGPHPPAGPMSMPGIELQYSRMANFGVSTNYFASVVQVKVPLAAGSTYPTSLSFFRIRHFANPYSFGTYWGADGDVYANPFAFAPSPDFILECPKPKLTVTGINECAGEVVNLTAHAVTGGALCPSDVVTLTFHTASPPTSGNQISNPASYTVTAATTLYAKASSGGCDSIAPIAVTLKSCPKVTYNGNGNTGSTPPADNTRYSNNDPVTVMPPGSGFVKNCHTFMGWAFTATATVPVFAYNGTGFTPPTFTITRDTTLYAVWRNDTVVPTFDLSAYPSNLTYCAGSTIPALPTTSKEGKNGTWSPAINNRDTTTYTFTPAGGECAKPTTIVIAIIPRSTAANINKHDTTICGGNPVNLATLVSAAGVANPKFHWYTTLTGNTPVNPLVVSPTDTTTYYVSVDGHFHCEGEANSTGRAAVRVNIMPKSTAANLHVHDGSICDDGSIDLSTLIIDTKGVSNAKFHWYTTQTGNITVSPLIVTPRVNTDYYVAVSGSNLCEGEANSTGREKVTIIVKPHSSIANINHRDTTICSGNSVNLTTMVSAIGVINPVFKYYTTLNGYTETPTTVSPTATANYYVAVLGDNYCEGANDASGRVEVTLTVAPPSTVANIHVHEDTICDDDSIDLSTLVTATGGVINAKWHWYTSVNGNTTLSPLTVSPHFTTTYYVAVSGDNFCEGAANSTGRKSLTITVKPRADIGNISKHDTTICIGSAVNLAMLASAVGVNSPIFHWYTTVNGSTVVNPLTVTPTDTTTYYVSVEGSNYCEGLNNVTGRAAVTVNVRQRSTASANINKHDTAICIGNAVNLTTLASAVGVNNPIVWHWYTTLTGNTAVVNHTSVAPITTTTYYVSVEGRNLCEGLNNTTGRAAVTVTVNPIPLPPTVPTSQNFCASATVGHLDKNGQNIIWYDQASGGMPLPSTQALQDGKIYYASQTANGCESGVRTQVLVRLKQPDELPAPNISSQTLCNGSLVSDLVVSGSKEGLVVMNASGTALLPTAVLSSGNYMAIYRYTSASGSCETTDTAKFAVTVNNTTPPPAPIIPGSQSFCAGATIGNIRHSTTGILWFATSSNAQTGTNPLSAETILTNNTTYYAIQAASNLCPGNNNYAAVQVSIGTADAPDLLPAYTLCDSSMLGEIAAGAMYGITWYDAAVGGNVVPLTKLLTLANTPYTFWATQKAGSCESPRTQVQLTIRNCKSVKLDLKVFLQGVTQTGSYLFKGVPKTGAYMTNNHQDPNYMFKDPMWGYGTEFANFKLPTTSPYANAVQTYAAINNPAGLANEIVDWVLVELWQTDFVGGWENYDYKIVERRSLLLQIDGSVVDVNGELPEFATRDGKYRIVVKHRNHMGVMSADSFAFNSGTVTFDFTTSVAQAQTDMFMDAQMVMKNGVSCLWAGDVNMDGGIEGTDMSNYHSDRKNANYPQKMGTYTSTDVTMDGFLEGTDLSYIAVPRFSMLYYFYFLGVQK